MKWGVMTCKEKRILQVCQCGIEKKTKRDKDKEKERKSQRQREKDRGRCEE